MIKNVFIDLAAGSQEYPGVCLSRIKGMISKWNMPSLSDNSVEEIFEIANDQESAAVEDENSTKKKDKQHGYIGEKGTGFKSVFKATKTPYISADEYSFLESGMKQAGGTVSTAPSAW